MNKILKRLLTGVLTLATVFTALPTTAVHAAETQYWTESEERVGIVEKVMNDGSIGSTFNEGHMTVEGEDAYCIDINTDFKNGYKTRSDASTRMTADQIEDVALSLEYVKQYTKSHTGLSSQHAYLLRQLVVWQRLSVHLGWSCDNVRASYDEISKSVQDEVFAGAKAFVRENKGRYDCYGYIYTGEGQDLGQFFAELAVGNGKIQKSSSNTTVTNGNDCYSLSGATYGVYSDKGCTKSVAILTTNANGNTDTVELRAATYYVKETKAPKGFQLDKNVYTMTVKVNETTTLKVSDKPKVTDTLVELFKIDMEISKATPQGNASLEGAEFVWKYYDGYYTKDNLPSEPTRTWTTKTIAEKDSNNEVHYITRLADSYKVLGDSFYTQNGTICLPLGTITVEEKTAPNGYLLEGAYMQAAGSSEQIKGVYVAQITEDGELAALSGSNQYSVLDKVIRGGVKIQKRDLESKDTKAQGGATLKDTAFEIISLNDNAVLVNGKLYNKNEVVKTIHTGVDGIATTAADTLPYGKYHIEESNAPEGYLTDGAKPIEFEITEDGKIVDLTDEAHSIYNQIKRGDIEGVKIGAGTHKRLANVPFRITGKTTGESHIIVTDANGQLSTSSDWVSHKQNTNAGKTSEDGIWFGTSTPDDSKGALLYDTYTIEELRCDSNKGMTLIPAFDVVVSRNKVVVDLGTLTDEYEPEITTCILLAFFDWRLALCMYITLPVAFLIIWLSKNYQKKLFERQVQAKLDASSQVQEYLEGMKIIKSCNLSGSHFSALNKALLSMKKIAVKVEMICGVFMSSASMILQAGIGIVIFVGTMLLVKGEIELLPLLMFFLMVTRIYGPILAILSQLTTLLNLNVVTERMRTLLSTSVMQGNDKEIENCDIELEHVTFRYNTKDVIKDVTCKIPQGSITALVGSSGSGKSTISKLIARFWDIQKGTIRVGGKDIRTMEPESLMRKMAFVFQDVTLFNDTVFNNISIGNPNATEEEVMAAAKAAYCDEFVRNMPDGYQTVLGENGSTLSGGERQRISIARALLKNASIIFLDEATASLDPENEVLVQKAIAQLVENKTVIMIAHRLRTVVDADQILVLDDGKLVEYGTHNELMKKKGVYQKLYHIQQESLGWTI